jgi:hypothetical protein
MKKYNFALFVGCLGLLKYLNQKRGTTHKNIESLLKYNDILDILQEEKVLRNQYKNMLHLSTPFNRKIKYIYNLPFFYTEYENYNFNKLSDFFLNIHIFIN